MTGKQVTLENESQTQTGIALTTNALFELFAVAYPFWNHGLTDDQIKAKKRLWAMRIARFTPEQINQVVDEVVDIVGDKSGPTIEQFLDVANSLRRQRERAAENDRVAREKGYESWDALCRDQGIGVYYEKGTEVRASIVTGKLLNRRA